MGEVGRPVSFKCSCGVKDIGVMSGLVGLKKLREICRSVCHGLAEMLAGWSFPRILARLKKRSEWAKASQVQSMILVSLRRNVLPQQQSSIAIRDQKAVSCGHDAAGIARSREGLD